MWRLQPESAEGLSRMIAGGPFTSQRISLQDLPRYAIVYSRLDHYGEFYRTQGHPTLKKIDV